MASNMHNWIRNEINTKTTTVHCSHYNRYDKKWNAEIKTCKYWTFWTTFFFSFFYASFCCINAILININAVGILTHIHMRICRKLKSWCCLSFTFLMSSVTCIFAHLQKFKCSLNLKYSWDAFLWHSTNIRFSSALKMDCPKLLI